MRIQLQSLSNAFIARKGSEMASLWKKVAVRIGKTRNILAGGVAQVLAGGGKLDETVLERLEEVLLLSDVGPETAALIADRLRDLACERGVTKAYEAQGLMEEVITGILTAGKAAGPGPGQFDGSISPGLDQSGGQLHEGHPHVILVVGVNGSGKTTSIGKLAWRSKQEGLKPLVVACDTFRAAALEQLDIWATRAGAEIIRSQSGGDPAAVAFDGVRAGQARGAGVVFVDTAGRLQTNANLMGELSKIRRVIGKALPGAPHETLLVLDATVGQNALSQVRNFTDAAGVTGILLAKLDGSAKGGIILAVATQLGVPVRYVGLGEGIEDLEEFQPASFARALLEPMEASH